MFFLFFFIIFFLLEQLKNGRSYEFLAKYVGVICLSLYIYMHNFKKYLLPEAYCNGEEPAFWKRALPKKAGLFLLK